MARFQMRGIKRKGFTLIEMLVTVGIIVLMTGIAVASLSSADTATNVANANEQFNDLVDQLKSFTAGPDQEKAAHYILVVRYAGTGLQNYCNKDVDVGEENQLEKNQYFICATEDKDLTGYGNTQLNNKFNKVVSGNFNSGLTISPTGFTSYNDAFVINIRTFDGQTGYNLSYCDPNSVCNPSTIQIGQDNINRVLTFEPVIGTLK